VAVPLAEAGYEVTAVDISPAMLARAEKAASEAGSGARLERIVADLIGLDLPGGARFRLAILALNSILLLDTREAQAAALQTMARHLLPGGVAVVDAWLPSATSWRNTTAGSASSTREIDPESGLLVTKTSTAQHEQATGHVILTAIYEEGEQGGSVRRWSARTDCGC